MSDWTLLRRRALGDVVLLGAVTAALGRVTVVTDPPYVALAARLRGVVRAVPTGTPVEGPVVDLQSASGPYGRRKRSVRRRLRLWGLPFRRPPVTALYGRAVGVEPVAPPWIDTPGGDALALIPGASTPIKRWSPVSFAAVGRAWDGPVVVLGGPGEEALVARVAAEIPGAGLVVERGFERTIEALGRCRVALGGDTGLLHLAAACGAVPVALLGPTHPDDGFFPYARGRALGLAMPCRPCTLHRRAACPVGHHGCMGHAVPDVVRAVIACASS